MCIVREIMRVSGNVIPAVARREEKGQRKE